MSRKSDSLSSLGELLRAQGFEALAEPEPGPKEETPRASVARFENKVVLRRERKGRGGKTVTTVQGVTGDTKALTDLVRTLKRQLGCGGRVDNGVLVFQGDCRDELADLLRAQGAVHIRIS